MTLGFDIVPLLSNIQRLRAMRNRVAKYMFLACISVITGFTITPYSCTKEPEEEFIDITREECMEIMKGLWAVQSIHRECSDHNIFYFNFGDSVQFNASPNIQLFFDLDDTAVCSLPFVENFGKWTFQVVNEELVLETEDYCGNVVNYSVDLDTFKYNRERWETGTWGNPYLVPEKTEIFVKLSLANSDTTIVLDDFTLYGLEFSELGFGVSVNNCGTGFVLVRQ